MTTRSRAGEPQRPARLVRTSARAIAPPSARALARLRRAMEGPIDTTEIPESKPGRAVRPARPTPRSRVTPPESAIRDAIRRELGLREITRYELWKRARRRHGPMLPESAGYEFLRGERQIGLDSVEVLLATVELVGVRREERVPTAR